VASKKLKRYSVSLPDELFNDIQQIAERQQITLVDVLRKCIKLGLIASKADNDPNLELIIREGDTERILTL
jgi:metal-responsive CopG/Arc/MetJ family transcriptional regulator